MFAPVATITKGSPAVTAAGQLAAETDRRRLLTNYETDAANSAAPVGKETMTDKPKPNAQTAQVMFTADGTKHVIAARSERDSADRHAVNGDLLAWGDYNELLQDSVTTEETDSAASDGKDSMKYELCFEITGHTSMTFETDDIGRAIDRRDPDFELDVNKLTLEDLLNAIDGVELIAIYDSAGEEVWNL